MSPAPGVQGRSRDLPLDRHEFESLTSDMLQALAQATGTPPDALKRSSAESLVVLRIVGDLVLPALRTAVTYSDQNPLEAVIHGPIADLVTIINAHGSLSVSTLWGNVASVIESSARLIAAENPEMGTRAVAIATESLRTEPLVDCWTGDVGAGFRRTSCCLVAGPDPQEIRCGDCVRGASSS